MYCRGASVVWTFCICSCVGSGWEVVLDVKLQYACHSHEIGYIWNEYSSGIVSMLYVHDIIGCSTWSICIFLGFFLMCITFLTYFYACCFLCREEKCSFSSSFRFCQHRDVSAWLGLPCAADAASPCSRTTVWAKHMGCCSEQNSLTFYRHCPIAAWCIQPYTLQAASTNSWAQ